MECFAKEHLSGQTQMITYFLKTYFSTPDFKFDLYQNCFLPLRSLSLDVTVWPRPDMSFWSYKF